MKLLLPECDLQFRRALPASGRGQIKDAACVSPSMVRRTQDRTYVLWGQNVLSETVISETQKACVLLSFHGVQVGEDCCKRISVLWSPREMLNTLPDFMLPLSWNWTTHSWGAQTVRDRKVISMSGSVQGCRDKAWERIGFRKASCL